MNIGLVFSLAAVLATASSAAPARAATPAETANVNVVQQLLAALQDPAPSADNIAALLTEDALVKWSSKDPGATGMAAVKPKLAGLFPAGRHYRIVTGESAVVGPMVIQRRTDIGVTNGVEGKPFKIVGVFVVRGGKIKVWTDYEDQ